MPAVLRDSGPGMSREVSATIPATLRRTSAGRFVLELRLTEAARVVFREGTPSLAALAHAIGLARLEAARAPEPSEPDEASDDGDRDVAAELAPTLASEKVAVWVERARRTHVPSRTI